MCVQITREPGPVKGGKTHIAFAEDPTGYKFELIQREKESSEPFAQVCHTINIPTLNVGPPS